MVTLPRPSFYVWGSILLLVCSVLSPAVYADDSNQVLVTTLAGGTGNAITFNHPLGVAVDGSGNVYVADSYNRLIRKINPKGVVTTLAGSGTDGSNDGMGTTASFVGPQGIAVDSSGNVYVGDGGEVRKISPDGAVTTLASGVGAYGVAVDSSGNVYVSDYEGNVVQKITPDGVVTVLAGGGVDGTDSMGNPKIKQGSDDGKGTGASFHFPSGIAVDSTGNVYVVDSGNVMIRKITRGGVVTTLCRQGPNHSPIPSLRAPRFLAVDSLGNFYVTDLDRILKISPKGVVAILAGTFTNMKYPVDGTGTDATFSDPSGIAVDSSGNVYVADTRNQLIRKISYHPASVNSGGQTDSVTNNSGTQTASGNAPAPSAGVHSNLSSLPDTGTKNGICNPGFVHGISGTLNVLLHFNFNYNAKDDRIIESENAKKEMQEFISGLAKDHTDGPQFVFVDKPPYDLEVFFNMAGRSNTGKGDYTAYWILADTYAANQSGYLLRFSTKAQEPDGDSPGLFGGWADDIVSDAANRWYDYIANGWKCN